MSALTDRFRVVRFDARGHGASAQPEGDLTIEQHAQDVLDLLDQLGCHQVSICGISMGGAIAQWIAAHAPDRVRALVLANTATRFGKVDTWNERIHAVRSGGMQSIVDSTLERWFTRDFAAKHPERVEPFRQVLLRMDPNGYAASSAAIRDFNGDADLARIQCPALVITGRYDPSTPPENGEAIAAHLARPRYLELEAAHISNVEAAAAFTEAVVDMFTVAEQSHG